MKKRSSVEVLSILGNKLFSLNQILLSDGGKVLSMEMKLAVILVTRKYCMQRGESRIFLEISSMNQAYF